jgi:hypothetical protein
MTTRDKPRVNRYQLKRWGLAALLLVALLSARLFLFRQPPQAEGYFKRVVAATVATPTSFGSWVSMDAPVPPAAITMLRPNVTVSRRYTNLQTGQQATFLLVQCADARDLMGHFPPVCYAAHGFREVAADAKDWSVEGLAIQGTVYTFSSTRPEDLSSMIIYDFMILPDGRTCRDMEGVNATARDPRKRQLGAAQLQVLVSPTMPEDQRDALFLTLVQVHRRTIDAILAGDPQ